MSMLHSEDCFFWFETNKVDKENFRSFYFNDPVEILTLTDPENLESFFSLLEQLTQKYYVAGFFSYELGYLLEDVFRYRKKSRFPYALFGAYKEPVIFDHKKGAFIPESFSLPDESCDYELSNLKINISEQQYFKKLDRIKEHISRGDIYQVNYTVKYKFDFSGSALGLYQDLKQKQNVAYNVFAGFGGYRILSVSPELFFYKNRDCIKVKPMKGTFERGRSVIEDNRNKLFLANDGKNRSENVMIVDLLRNDLGRVSEYDSVKVTKMFEVEKYDTLFQMTSTIKSTLKKNLVLYGLIKGIFPSGSVTGAPKIRSMQIIRDLEKEERKIYTGSIGFFQPDGKAKFNVAIRTVLIKDGKGEMGVGGGIVHDSKMEDELHECNLKAQFLIKKPVASFKLIETLLFDKEFKHLDLHLKRLKESAEYFDFKFNRKEVMAELLNLKTFLENGKYKVRLTLDKSGKITSSYDKVNSAEKDFRITISKHRTSSSNVFYFHKTTNRKLYEQELKAARKKRFFDALFLNEKDEITEGAITNVFIEKNGMLYTPPVECGLLNGVMRQVVTSKYNVREKTVKLMDLESADDIYISNSIIGFRKADIIFKIHKSSVKNPKK